MTEATGIGRGNIANFTKNLNQTDKPSTHVTVKFSINEDENKRLRLLGGDLSDHIEAALELFLGKKSQQRFNTTLHCGGQPVVLYARIGRELYERAKMAWSNDVFGEAIGMYLSQKRLKVVAVA